MLDEGYIKYRCHWVNTPSVTATEIVELNQCRQQLYQLGLIGQYDNGIGFGNLSIRVPVINHQRDKSSTSGKVNRQSINFIISGTQTGGIPNLTTQHYTRVTEFDWQQNFVSCQGLIKASSETLTHAALYCANPDVKGVVHVHQLQLWEQLIDRVATTARDCAYGTPAMAEEIIRLSQQETAQQQKIIVMSGHPEGIITFGNTLTEATKVVLERFLALNRHGNTFGL